MFVCLSPNPAIDKRLRLARLELGGVNRAIDVKRAPGGKSTHVAMVLRTLGADPLWIGFTGGANGQELLEGLSTLGIRTHAIRTPQATRVNLEIIDDIGKVTEILEPGATPSPSEIASFHDACEEQFARGKSQMIVVASGSLPPEMPRNFYAALVRRAHAHGCQFFLDTSGEALRSALEARPDFVKPNREEAEWTAVRKIADAASAAAVIRHLFSAGAKSAAISLGEGGLVWCPKAGQDVYFAASAAVQAISAVGCGDAVVAAFAYAAAARLTPEESLALAAACGAANCLAETPGAVRLADIQRLQREICVERLA
ncbi:MAG TPA: 1-phosphofructokinase family hexose kinase [Candidatus Dormibacteraeota bacterium]|nr:1-phosphofructokinase family hexose kinase [Candidatus Dormibacteraeota bacterium]